MSEVAKKVKIRAAHRGSATKLLNRLKDRLSDEENPADKFWLKESIQSMRLKIESLKTLDDQIIDLIASGTTEGVEERIEKEIENSDGVRAELNDIVMRMEEMMSKFDPPPPMVQQSVLSPSAQVHNLNMASGIPQQSKTKASLPKLEVRKFHGKIQEWQEFWDAFESAIDQNESLTAVDKFSYLRSLVTEPARSTIAGFSLTAVNYAAAVDVLKKKYGKEIAIQRAHVNDLLNLAPVFSDKDTTRLRKLYDGCGAHFRGLKALGVDETTFAAVVVPAVLQKLPEAFRLTITRGADFLNWSMEELLSAFLKELELSEDHYYSVSSGGNTQNRKDSNTLYTKQEVENCAFCLGRHASANCKKVSDVNERKNILVKYGRCFKCIQKGHRARDCKSIELCNKCGRSHHISICDEWDKPTVSEFEVRPEANPTTTSPSSFHVGAGDRVALQTARAVITGEGQPQRVRVLFDAGSHRSFVAARVARLARLPVTRQDWLAISTFGQRSREMKLRHVVQVKVSPIEGGGVH